MTVFNAGLPPDRGPAPVHTDFSPDAVMARAEAFVADQARRSTARLRPAERRTAAVLLTTIAAEIEAQAPVPAAPAPGGPSAAELLASIARELDGGRA